VLSEKCSIEEQSIEYCRWACWSSGAVSGPQLKISQKALGTLPEDDNVTPKHV
jgi:hypothetical protein